jgi:hypothetical protein
MQDLEKSALKRKEAACDASGPKSREETPKKGICSD